LKPKSKIEKRFRRAVKAALESDFRVQVGCAVYNKGKLITTGASTNKTHPLQHKFNSYRDFDCNANLCLDKAHAEMIALSRLKSIDIDMKDVTFYVVRLCKSQPFGLARPCKACLTALRNAGVRRVCYSTQHGYAEERI